MTVSRQRWLRDDVQREWVDGADRMDRMLAPLGDRLLAAAALHPGDAVLDIGCGTGSTTLAAWQAVRPTGTVTGIDVSPLMLATARRRLNTANIDNHVRLIRGDAAHHQFRDATLTAIISRFGVGHFTDPVRAFTRLRHALTADGRLVFTEWAGPDDNEWMTLVEDTANRVLGPLPGHHRPQHHPAFATLDSLHEILEAADFDIAITAIAEQVPVGYTVDDVLGWFLELPDATFLAHVDIAARWRYLDALRAELQHRVDSRGVHLGATAWLVEASPRSSPHH